MQKTFFTLLRHWGNIGVTILQTEPKKIAIHHPRFVLQYFKAPCCPVEIGVTLPYLTKLFFLPSHLIKS